MICNSSFEGRERKDLVIIMRNDLAITRLGSRNSEKRSRNYEICQVGVKRKTKEGELDPNAVTGGQIKETNGELY